MQSIAVALLVFGCTVYAVWTLLPNVARRGIATRVEHWPWPGFIARRLQKAAQGASGGCACDAGCGSAAPKSPDEPQTIHFHRGPRR